MPGCEWYIPAAGDDAAATAARALLREKLGPGPYLPGVSGYGAVMDALDRDKAMRANRDVKNIVACAVLADRASFLNPCVAP